jgi:heme/copper-type cytochrome/quinol oxidase subunit 1
MAVEKSEARNDLALGIVLLIGSIFVFVESLKIPASPYEPLGAGFVPKTISLALGLLSIIVIVSSFYEVKRGAKGKDINNEESIPYKKHPLLAWAVIICVFLDILLMPLIGFRLATFLLVSILGTLIFKNERKLGLLAHCLTLLTIAVAMSFGLYYLFTKIMFINLP